MRCTNWCKVDAIKDRKQVISTVHQSVESFTVTSGQCDHRGGGGGDAVNVSCAPGQSASKRTAPLCTLRSVVFTTSQLLHY